RRLRVHTRVQGRAPRGARGRVHRAHVWEHPGEHPARSRGRGGRAGAGRRRRRRRARTARPRAREHAEVRGRSDVDDVRDLLGGGGRRCALAGRRRVAAGRPRLRVPRVVRVRPAPPRYEAGGDRVRFARFWWDFIVGDDPLAALGVAAAIGATAALAAADVAAWWLLPLAVLVVLYASLRRAAR